MAGLPPEARPLRVPGADWAVLDLPTGRLMLRRGHNDIMGSVDELRALARAMLAACDQAELRRAGRVADRIPAYAGG